MSMTCVSAVLTSWNVSVILLGTPPDQTSLCWPPHPTELVIGPDLSGSLAINPLYDAHWLHAPTRRSPKSAMVSLRRARAVSANSRNRRLLSLDCSPESRRRPPPPVSPPPPPPAICRLTVILNHLISIECGRRANIGTWPAAVTGKVKFLCSAHLALCVGLNIIWIVGISKDWNMGSSVSTVTKIWPFGAQIRVLLDGYWGLLCGVKAVGA
jgi:hypothetical protein